MAFLKSEIGKHDDALEHLRESEALIRGIEETEQTEKTTKVSALLLDAAHERNLRLVEIAQTQINDRKQQVNSESNKT